MKLKFCVNLTFLLNEYERLEKRCEAAHRLGFEAVEFAFPPHSELESVIAKINLLSLQLVLVNISTHESYPFGCAAAPGQQANFLENLTRTIAFAKQTNCRKIHLTAGLRITSNDVDFENQLNVYKENLEKAADLLESENMIGLIEPICNDAVPFYFLNNYELEINKKSLRLQLDVFHLQKIKGDLTKCILEYLPFISHIQIAQLPDRNEPLSSGEINYEYILDLIENQNYTDWIGLEFKPSRRSEDVLQKMVLSMTKMKNQTGSTFSTIKVLN